MFHQPRQLARRTRLQRAQGIEIEERVWQLYVSGWRQVAIAAELGLSESRVSRYLKRRLERIEQEALHSPQELAAMRERLAAGIWATIEETYIKPTITDREGNEVEMPYPANMLMVRLKALDQLAKLYGLNLECQPRRENVTPYVTPPEIANRVKGMLLELHGRATSGSVSSPDAQSHSSSIHETPGGSQSSK